MENAVEKAIRILGPSMFEASMRTGIHPATLYKWVKAGRIKDGRRAVQIARATNGQVSVEELVGAEPAAGPNGGTRANGGKISVTSPDSPTTETPSPLFGTPAQALAA